MPSLSFRRPLAIGLVITITAMSMATALILHASASHMRLAHILPAAPAQTTLHMRQVVAGTPTYATHLPTPYLLPAALTGAGNGLGEPGFYTFASTRCGCYEKGVRVNVANGNVVLKATDLHIAGTGIDLAITTYYNSQANASTDMGVNWRLAPGADIYLHVNSSTSVDYYGPDGYAINFTATNGIFNQPPGLNASLTYDSTSQTYTLTFHKSGEKQQFTSTGELMNDTDKNGNHLTFSYNGSGQLATITDTQGRVTSFGYDGNGHITTITDPASRTVQYGYDSGGHLTSSTDLNGKKTTFGYNGSDLTTITDPLNNTTTIAYDGSHRATSITDATTAKTTFTYNSGNTVVTDARNNPTTYTYDTSTLQVSSVKDALGHMRSTQYSPNYDVTQTTDPLTDTDIFTYSTDGNNNLQSATDGSGAKTSYQYTNSSHPYYPSSATDAQGNTVAYTYDSVGNLTTSQDGLSSQNTVKYTYNSNGTVHTATDADGNVTTYGYDTQGNLTTVTPPSPLGGETIGYDGLSRVTSFTDGKGQKTTFAYDNLDRRTLVTYADNSTIAYTYDDDGNVLTEKDSTGTTTFTYNAVNEPLTKVLPDSTTFTMTYDGVGNLATFNDGSGALTYGYNAVNDLTSLKEASGATTTFGYDNADRRTSTSYPNGVVLSITYDGAGHELSIVGKKGTTTFTAYDYTYTVNGKASGLRASMTTGGATTTYAYDKLNRLTTIDPGQNQTSYSYDGNGNRTHFIQGTKDVAYGYNGANELTSLAQSGVLGTTSFTYDGNGNETGETNSKTGTLYSFAYNAKNQTTSVNSTAYAYSGPTQTERVTDGSSHQDSSPLGLSVEVNGSTTARYVRDNRGNLVGENVNGQRNYYLFDGLGSVVGITNSSSTEIISYTYDAWGTATMYGSGVSNPWQYAGGYADATGLLKFGERYYDPGLGRWTQQDPIGGSLFDPSTGNRYAYADDDPITLMDATGRTPDTACGVQITAESIILFGGLLAVVGAAILATGTAAALIFGGAFFVFVGGAILLGKDFFTSCAT